MTNILRHKCNTTAFPDFNVSNTVHFFYRNRQSYFCPFLFGHKLLLPIPLCFLISGQTYNISNTANGSLFLLYMFIYMHHICSFIDYRTVTNPNKFFCVISLHHGTNLQFCFETIRTTVLACNNFH